MSGTGTAKSGSSAPDRPCRCGDEEIAGLTLTINGDINGTLSPVGPPGTRQWEGPVDSPRSPFNFQVNVSCNMLNGQWVIVPFGGDPIIQNASLFIVELNCRPLNLSYSGAWAGSGGTVSGIITE